jgi:hypothetical protein
MLDDALARYKRTTRNDLLTLWLASEMQTCDSFDAVLDILRDQAKAFERSDDQRLMKWIDPLAHVLHTFSDALDGVSSVLIKNPLHDNLTNLIHFSGATFKAFPPENVIFTGIGALLAVRVLAIPFRGCPLLTPKFYRRRRMSEHVTVLSLTSSSASRACSGPLEAKHRFR